MMYPMKQELMLKERGEIKCQATKKQKIYEDVEKKKQMMRVRKNKKMMKRWGFQIEKKMPKV